MIIKKIKDFLKKNKKEARKIYIYSGAGISAESGISTFRGKNGLWNEHKIEEISDFTSWLNNYNLVHDFYNKRRTELKNIQPNDAHNLIKNLQNIYGVENVINITTNVDDLFEKAGVENTTYLHGKLNEIKNIKTNEIISIGNNNFEYLNKDKKYKPNVIFFNERPVLYTKMSENNYNMKDGDVVISIGMSFAILKPDRFIPKNKNIFTININTEENNHSAYDFDYKITERATRGIIEAIKYLKITNKD